LDIPTACLFHRHRLRTQIAAPYKDGTLVLAVRCAGNVPATVRGMDSAIFSWPSSKSARLRCAQACLEAFKALRTLELDTKCSARPLCKFHVLLGQLSSGELFVQRQDLARHLQQDRSLFPGCQGELLGCSRFMHSRSGLKPQRKEGCWTTSFGSGKGTRFVTRVRERRILAAHRSFSFTASAVNPRYVPQRKKRPQQAAAASMLEPQDPHTGHS
jgi:hypothetical protein